MEKPIKTISPQWSKMSTLNVGGVCRKALPWLWWGGLPSIVLVSGMVLYETWQTNPIEPTRPIELMSKVSVVALPMSEDDKKAAEIRYLPMPRWQLETLPQRVIPRYANPSRQNSPVANSNTVEKPKSPPLKSVKPSVIPEVTETPPKTASAPAIDDNPWDIEQLDFTGMSDELVAQLKMAIADTQRGSQDEETLAKQMVKEAQSQDPQAIKGSLEKIVSLYALPEDVKHSLPKIDLQTHLYSSVAEKRLIRVNGMDVAEGEIMAEGVMLEKIDPRQIIFWFDGHRIAMPALSEW